MTDILERLAACMAGTVTPEDRDAITLEACAEITRLRLTDAEREALGKACDLADYAGFHSTTRAVLRGLLKRLGGKECTA